MSELSRSGVADLIRVLPNGWTAEAVKLTYGRGRLNVTRNPEHVGSCYDDNW